ncbi:hypothetical protein [uncultured Akkermansia sp.]|uniref:hypothetical protein n=1 Tax=uncultured Akkermansia sp. TaxID=512294 RepID=UPI0026094A0C|nr:hypothetical protein [uncultured Akkermansia sp.]
MKDKSIKQPWPRSAKVTVWVLGVVLALSFVWHMSFRVAAYDYLCDLELELAYRKVIEDYAKFDAENDVKLGINRKEGYMLGANGEKLDIPFEFLEISPDAFTAAQWGCCDKAFKFCFPLLSE